MAAPALKTIENWKVVTNLNSDDYLLPEYRYVRLHGVLSKIELIKAGWIVELMPPCGEWRKEWKNHKDFPLITTLSGSIYVLGEPADDFQWNKLVACWGRLHGAAQFGYTEWTLDLIRSRQVS